MRKPNISGLVSKCKELWKNLVEIKDLLEEEISSANSEARVTPKEELHSVVESIPAPSENPIATLDEDNNEDDMSEEDVKIYLNEVNELFNDYIGISISGFDSFNDSIEDLERKIGPYRGTINMISGVEIDDKYVWIQLHNFDGRHGGYLKIAPSPTAKFSEKPSSSEPDRAAAYRIKFVGDDSIEYMDQDGKGQISYFAGYRQ